MSQLDELINTGENCLPFHEHLLLQFRPEFPQLLRHLLASCKLGALLLKPVEPLADFAEVTGEPHNSVDCFHDLPLRLLEPFRHLRGGLLCFHGLLLQLLHGVRKHHDLIFVLADRFLAVNDLLVQLIQVLL